MKKRNILNLIKYHAENNDSAFRTEAYEIARYFDSIGDLELAEYIMSLMSKVSTLSPQIDDSSFEYLEPLDTATSTLPLPDKIMQNIVGLINAIGHNIGVNKFLFEGPPGTGKTETCKQIARILDRQLYVVNFELLVDSRLGQTAKNIASLFDEINRISVPEKVIILFDEIDAIAIHRIHGNDIREMGRATSAILKGFDHLNDRIVVIATTNLYSSFDRALIRRFDSVIDFDAYTREDLQLVAESILDHHLVQFKYASRNIRLFRKILLSAETLPYPGELKNMIRTSLAFGSDEDEFDYLKRLYTSLHQREINLNQLKLDGFTVRETEILTGVSKSQVAREWKGA